jgi:hypothetical protein
MSRWWLHGLNGLMHATNNFFSLILPKHPPTWPTNQAEWKKDSLYWQYEVKAHKNQPWAHKSIIKCTHNNFICQVTSVFLMLWEVKIGFSLSMVYSGNYWKHPMMELDGPILQRTFYWDVPWNILFLTRSRENNNGRYNAKSRLDWLVVYFWASW